ERRQALRLRRGRRPRVVDGALARHFLLWPRGEAARHPGQSRDEAGEWARQLLIKGGAEGRLKRCRELRSGRAEELPRGRG
ncbi:hypothetical protein, partial [Myxococcus llanfairpwllgwyngyllgogerychwyrndrobwllllantysiliogogogochensis]|uniref:hypothetical protein n=1 Tax=Myxococcus llanfairpwllgwyngyllgogerychwyrndrobwllllantysiliogogogochensis TaxID=2590453 RepID=UPI001C67A136